MKNIARYDHIGDFEPLLPRDSVSGELRERAHSLERAAAAAQANAAPHIVEAIRDLLRAMNSYYTNKIEGHHTTPLDIDNTLRANYSDDVERARKQKVAFAHINAERKGELLFAAKGWDATFSVDVFRELHRFLFEHLDASDLQLPEGGTLWPLGEFREKDVSVGRHIAPTHGRISQFMQRLVEVYRRVPKGESQAIAIAAAHQRFAWIHPFRDGNGRVARLHSHLLMQATGLSKGLWSPLRGLARTQEEYLARISNADAPRQGDLDGRGHLSEKALVEFICYFIDVCVDQATFMAQVLRLQDMPDRIADCLHSESRRSENRIRIEALRAMQILLIVPSLSRGEFKALTGLGTRTAEGLVKALLDRRLVESDTPKGALRLGFPLHSLRFYLPQLWPEAEAESIHLDHRSA